MRVTLWEGVGVLIGVGLLTWAAFLYQDSLHVRNKHTEMPLNTPVSLAPGDTETPEFVAEKESYYHIEIASHGGAIDWRNTNVSWTLLEHGHAIAKGDAISYQGSDGDDQVIGSFRPEQDGHYKIHLSIRTLAWTVGTSAPELKVILDPGQRDDIAMGAGFLELEAEICGVIGLVMLSLVIVRIFKSRGMPQEQVSAAERH
jgi:hypothetical protein